MGMGLDFGSFEAVFSVERLEIALEEPAITYLRARIEGRDDTLHWTFAFYCVENGCVCIAIGSDQRQENIEINVKPTTLKDLFEIEKRNVIGE